MESWLPRFDELYVVSDLHLGGCRDEQLDFQIFKHGQRLAAFVRHARDARPDDDVALVLNGDVFDSLAEDVVPGYVARDAATSLALMERLYGDPSFAPVWQALADFVRAERRHLIVLIGNHDVELALPSVQRSLQERLAGGDAGARARLVFAAHGEGFGCLVGEARVFCTHGNEVDPWNWVDHHALAQLAQAVHAGRTVPAARWKPNGGTRLVVDVMNRVKRRFPFVDLLKPEGAALLGVLVVLGQEILTDYDLAPFAAIAAEYDRGRGAVRDLLGDGRARRAPLASAQAPAPLDGFLGPSLRKALHAEQAEDALLAAAARAVAAEASPLDGLGRSRTRATLGPVSQAGTLLWGALGRLPVEETLRCALADWLKADRTYDVLAADAWDDALCARAGDDVDFLIAGHTHLARARRRERGFYFNSGTWARLLHLTPQMLADHAVFAQRVWPALSAGRLSALDNASLPGPNGDLPLLLDRTTAVRVARDGATTVGELLLVQGADDESEPLAVTTMPGTSPCRRG